MSKPVELALVDTGLWFALCDDRDQHHLEAARYEDILPLVTILFPWPSLYETLNSRFVRRRPVFERFEKCLSDYVLEFVNDLPYREEALRRTLSFARVGKRPISMVDMIIRLMLNDDCLRKHYLITFNKEDFFDVCLSNGIEML